MNIEYLDHLEAKIDELLAKHESLIQRNGELMEIIQRKDQEIEQQQFRISEMQQEKEHVSRRVGELLNKFETLKSM